MRSFSTIDNILLIYQFLTQYSRIKEAPFLSQRIIKKHQFNKIKKLIDVAYNHTAFYRQKYDAAGVHPNDIRNLNDFKSLPTVTKDELAEHNIDFVDNRLNIDNLFCSRSSGTTGTFVDIYLDSQAFITQAIQVVRMLKELNPRYSPLNKELLVYTLKYPYSSIGGLYKVFYINNLLSAEKIIATILRVKPTILAIYPSILREMVNLGNISFSDLGIETIITNSEYCSQTERDLFADIFDCLVFDEYSSEELLSISYQCRCKQYHLIQDCSYIELLSPNTDTEVMFGQQGEIIGTCLINFATPIIRYRQNDLAVIISTQCNCGRTAPVLRNLFGRKNSSFKTTDNYEIPSGRILDWTYSLVLTLGLGIREFQIIQQTLICIVIKIVVNKSYRPDSDNQRLIDNFEQNFGKLFDLKIEIVKYIAKTESGKHNAIISLV